MDRKTVKIACSQPGGLQIRLLGAAAEEGGMPSTLTRITLAGPSAHGAGVNNPTPQLAPAFTEVDEKLWKAWFDQNTGKNPLLDSGVIYEVKDDGKPAEDHLDGDGERGDQSGKKPGDQQGSSE